MPCIAAGKQKYSPRLQIFPTLINLQGKECGISWEDYDDLGTEARTHTLTEPDNLPKADKIQNIFEPNQNNYISQHRCYTTVHSMIFLEGRQRSTHIYTGSEVTRTWEQHCHLLAQSVVSTASELIQHTLKHAEQQPHYIVRGGYTAKNSPCPCKRPLIAEIVRTYATSQLIFHSRFYYRFGCPMCTCDTANKCSIWQQNKL